MKWHNLFPYFVTGLTLILSVQLFIKIKIEFRSNDDNQTIFITTKQSLSPDEDSKMWVKSLEKAVKGTILVTYSLWGEEWTLTLTMKLDWK